MRPLLVLKAATVQPFTRPRATNSYLRRTTQVTLCWGCPLLHPNISLCWDAWAGKLCEPKNLLIIIVIEVLVI